MLYHFETTKELTELSVDCIKTDLDVALDFAQIARQTDGIEKVARNQHNARKGYDAGLHFISAANVTRFDREIVESKLLLLKSALLGLGESF